jgi:hypothetical protein
VNEAKKIRVRTPVIHGRSSSFSLIADKASVPAVACRAASQVVALHGAAACNRRRTHGDFKSPLLDATVASMDAFSLRRAIHLACIVLEWIAIVGLLIELTEFFGYLPRLPFNEAIGVVFLRFVALSILTLFLLQVSSLFVDWRRALFGLLRAVLYCGLAALPLTALP